MLILIVALVVGLVMYRGTLRLEGASAEDEHKSAVAYVDGVKVDSYVEDRATARAD